VIIGVPSAVFLFKYNFLKVFLVTFAGGLTANVGFTYLSASIIKWIHNYRLKKGVIHKNPVFNKRNRRIIKIKNKFGLAGIAILTPLISMPIGAFVAEKFYKDKKKVIFYLSVSVIIWIVGIYSVMYFFHDAFKPKS
jgi:hypothetical protein